MNNHPYLRAYLAGIALPTMFLLVALTGFCVARFAYHVPAPIERLIVFPMAIIPNLFGVWNILHLALRSELRLPLGIHGAILPFILAPAGFIFARWLGILNPTSNGLVYFGLIRVPYVHLAFMFPAAVVIYYLVWKYLIAFFNRVVGVAK